MTDDVESIPAASCSLKSKDAVVDTGNERRPRAVVKRKRTGERK